MRLLITTQAVDQDDQALGFFHGWLAQFSRSFESVHVICLKEGEHALPENISIHSLGKERNPSRIKYVWRFYRFLFSLWGKYDAVFAHMNQEYVLLGGFLWRLGRKHVVLWRNHKYGSVWTWLASRIAHTVCYTSPDAYVASYHNAVRMPIGVDTSLFKPKGFLEQDSILFLGRLDAVKRPDIFLEAIKILRSEGISVPVHVYGDPTPGREEYANKIKKQFSGISNVSFREAVPHSRTADLYASHSVYVNITPSGSFDKTIGEAMASGCITVAANMILQGVIPDELIVDSRGADSVAGGIRAALRMSEIERTKLRERSRAYVEDEHSLSLLVERLVGILTKWA